MTALDDKCISIRDYIDVLMAERDRRYEDRFIAQQEALKLALAAKNTHVATAISLVVGLSGLVAALLALWKH